MQMIPDAADMLEAVAEWLEGPGGAALSGAERYNARVAARALRGVEREVRSGPAYFDEDRRALHALLPDIGTGEPGFDSAAIESDEQLLSALATAIRDGRCDHRSPELLKALHDYTLRRLQLINPRYPVAADRGDTVKEDRV
ncbi:DUF6285 domain-containing protein [Nocardia sp. NPDC050712]|uniref:DUF6285 domain-containing protein n=1 Tax=Nocardia sp. NPDC050712 TaxID=3155518 RepID=UPI003408065E